MVEAAIANQKLFDEFFVRVRKNDNYDSSQVPSLQEVVDRELAKETNRACDICPAWFYTQGELEVHLKDAHTCEVFRRCKECGEIFPSTSTLATHLIEANHKVEGKICLQCGKTFATTYLLNRHQLSHQRKRKQVLVPANDRLHVCPACGKLFTTTFDLLEHWKDHFSGMPRMTRANLAKLLEQSNANM